jgi:hypothetical protein
MEGRTEEKKRQAIAELFGDRNNKRVISNYDTVKRIENKGEIEGVKGEYRYEMRDGYICRMREDGEKEEW